MEQDEAICNEELPKFELSETQKAAIDKELELIVNNPSYLQKWEDIRERYQNR